MKVEVLKRPARRPRISPELKGKIQVSLATLQGRAEATDGPKTLAHAFTDASRYPEFDADPPANHETGWLQGVADGLGVNVLDLLSL